MKHILVFIAFSLLVPVARAQSEYSVSIPETPKTVTSGHLNLGGTDPSGNRMDFNSFYMEVNRKPFIPIMGEFHYSRFPHQYWEEEIMKMKSGGINVIATYVFWILHETEEGVFDWQGDRNLRQFLELCKKHQVYAMVRIGPFCHGEIRNGALPDWLYGRPFEVRSNDGGYLFYVKRLYREIAKQLQGLYYKDGGTVIGIQLENELQHSAAPWAFSYPEQPREMTVANYDREITRIGVSVQDRRTAYAGLGSEHLATLKKIAVEEGMVVPLYTVTGWGNAAILENEAIPVTAAYPYPFWSNPSKSGFFLFKDIQKNPDYAPVRYDGYNYPSFCAEMGAGIQITYARRPRVPAEASEALMLRTLGSGANGIGYYMYHGGLTPQRNGGGFFSDEAMGVPKVSYDFQAPIGEYGKVRDSYHYLRIIHLFTENFASQLAPMGVVLPETNALIEPGERETLRYAVRSNGKAGFVFMSNFQDHDEREDQSVKSLKVQLKDEVIQFPTFVLKKGASAIFPFNMPVGDCILKYATVQPLAIKEINGKKHYFFYTHDGFNPEYVFDRHTVKKISAKKTEKPGRVSVVPQTGLQSTFSITGQSGNEIFITTLSRQQALNFNEWKHNGRDYFCITDAAVLQDGPSVRLQACSNQFTVTLPAFLKVDFGRNKVTISQKTGIFTEYKVDIPAIEVDLQVSQAGKQRFTCHLPQKAFAGQLSDIILEVDYTGDTGMAFIDGKIITDHLYYGNAWRIGLKQYAKDLEAKGMYFHLRPMYKNASYLIDFEKDKVPAFKENTVCSINRIRAIPEYSVTFNYLPE
jgi:hypothetical protein